MGNVYIGDLNSDWPLGTDIPDAGDDHIRGVKNVLKRSFPNIDGPVTLTQAQINGAAFPAGTRMLFQQSASPTGWTKVTDHDDKALRVVSGSVVNGGTVGFSTALGVGGATGGHALTGQEMPSHTHGKGTLATVAHSHGPTGSQINFVGQWQASPTIVALSTGGFRIGTFTATSSAAPAITGFTAAFGENAEHTHPLAIDVAYVDTIIAEKA